MEPALSTRIPDGFMAALRLGGEKPHQGVRSQNPAPNQVREVCNFTVLLGLQAAAVLNRVGSRSTGKERDTESGNDYFGARYYASSMGRFMSPDWSAQVEPVPYSKLVDPQSLNLYAYVYNNPITGVDPDGHQLASPDRWGCQANEPGCQNNSNDNAATKTNALNAYISGGGVGMRPGEAQQTLTPQQPKIGPSQTQIPASVIPVEIAPFSPDHPLTNQAGNSVSGNLAGVLVNYQVVDAKGFAVVDKSLLVQEKLASTPDSVNPPVGGSGNGRVFQTFGGRFPDVLACNVPCSSNSTTTQTFTAVGMGPEYTLSTQNQIRITHDSSGYPTVSVTNTIP